jgi:hypothetical protein
MKSPQVERNMKVRLPLIIALFIFAPGTPQAQVTVDVSKLTCEQLLMQKLAWPSKFAVLWLHGYYNGKRSNTIIEPAVMEQDERKVGSYCYEHREMTVMDAVKNALGLDK